MHIYTPVIFRCVYNSLISEGSLLCEVSNKIMSLHTVVASVKYRIFSFVL